MRADINGLNSVRSELNQGLYRIRQALETYIEEDAGRDALESCLDELHQIGGSLKVLRLYGAALLADDMHQALQAIMDETVEADESVFDVLFGAGLQLGDYLDYLPQAQLETDLLLLPVINELRVALQQPVLGEDDLFVYVLNMEPVDPVGVSWPPGEEDISAVAKRSLAPFQSALLGVMKQAEGPHLDHMISMADALRQASKSVDLQRLWWLTGSVFEALQDGGLVAGIELKRLLGRLSLLLRNLASQGEAAMGNAERSLSHGLLYQLGRSLAGGEQVSAVREAYALDALLPDGELLEQIRGRLRGPNTSLLQTVSGEIRKDLSEVRDNIDLLMRAGELSDEHSQQTAAALHRVGSTLGMLGLEDLQRVVQRQAKVIDSAQAAPDPESPQWQGVATSLLWIDHSLEHVLLQRERGEEIELPSLEPQSGAVSPQELQAGSLSIQREALANLSRVKELIEAFSSSGEAARLDDAPDLLHEISAALGMLGHTETADLVSRLRVVLESSEQHELIDDPDALSRVADVIIDTERLIGSLDNEQADKQAMLVELQSYVDGLDGGAPEVLADVEEEAFLDVAAVAPPAADSMQDIFLEELGDIQNDLAEHLPLWIADNGDLGALGEVRRRFHTLKGSGRMVGAIDIGEFGWAVENLLNRCLEADKPISSEVVALVENAVAQLPTLARGFADEATLSDEARSLIVEAHGLAGTTPPDEYLSVAAVAADTDEAAESFAQEIAAVAALQDEKALEAGEQEGDIQHIFLRDALEHLEHLATFFAGAGPQLDPQPVSNEVVRAFHTLKSGAALANLPAMSKLSSELEQLCDLCLQHGELMSTEALQIVQQASGGLLQTLEAFQAGNELPELDDLTQDVIELREVLGLPDEDDAEQLAEQAEILRFTDEAYDLTEQIEARLAALEVAADPDERDRLLAALRALGDLAQAAGIGTVAGLADGMREQLQSVQALSAAQREGFGEVALGVYGLLDELRQGRLELEAEDLMQRLKDIEAQAEVAAPDDEPVALDVVEEAPQQVEQPEPEQVETSSAEELAAEAPIEAIEEPAEVETVVAQPQFADTENAAMLEMFLEEGEELLEGIDQSMDAWQSNPQDADAAAEILRLLHTIKGGARMAGAEAIGDISHELESEIEAQRRSGSEPDKSFVSGLRASVDKMHGMLEAFQKPVAEAASEIDKTEPEPVKPPTTEATGPVSTSWAESLYWQPEVHADTVAAGAQSETARVHVGLLDGMLNEAGEINIYRGRLEKQHADLAAQLVEFEQAVERLRGLIRELDMQTDSQVHAGRAQTEASASSDRYDAHFDPLEMDRYTRLNELSRSLNEGAADLASLHALMDETSRDAETLLLQQGRVATSLQHGLMDTLLVPFTRQVQRLQRIVRQTCQTHDRSARIEFAGEEGELDRNVLERMTGPLEHLLRNAIVHGIEPAKDRKKAGKQEEGLLRVVLRRDGTQSIIEVSDDGRGLDMKAIRKHAESRGLIPKKAKVDDDVLWQFIFEPGFSTAKKLTQEAGRGVGMDVVNAEIKQLGGTISVSTTPKKGTRFAIRIPSSLAISNSLLIQVDAEQFAIPMASIEGVERIDHDALNIELGPQGEPLTTAKGIHYGGNDYQVVRLADYLSKDAAGNDDAAPKSHPVLLIQAGENRLALVVDKVLGGQELVVKSLGPQVSALPGIKGGAILADGSVILILDIQALHQAQRRRGLAVAATDSGVVERVEDQRPMIMVVDDSITIRRVTEKFLLRNGFRVCLAKDGMDALPMLQTESPDLVLLDIEMPRIDGFEFATYMRNSDQFVAIPIIMITSRSGDKHKKRAAQIGVQEYMVKPYQEDVLLKSIHAVMQAAKQPQEESADEGEA